MKPFMGLLLLAVAALLVGAPARAECPDGPDCIWVDQATCGECASSSSDCSTSGDCPSGTCTGACTVDGITPCVGDADCLPLLGVCTGLCSDAVTACVGDGGCAVCNGGTPGAGTQASPYCVLNEAYQAASDGDTIYVGPGAYRQCAGLFGMSLPVPEIRSVHLLARAFDESGENPSTIGDTIIDGTEICTDAPVVTLFGSNASMKGLTVTGGNSSGVLVAGSVTITSNRITENSSVLGGGIYVYTASCYYAGESVISITDNEITDNQAIAGPQGSVGEFLGNGGGIGVVAVENYGAGCGSVIEIEIKDNLVRGNNIANNNVDPEGIRYVASGGGIYVATALKPSGSVNVDIQNNEVFDNGLSAGTPASAGGGIFVTTDFEGRGSASIVVRGNTIGPDNVAHEGGGLAAWARTRLQGQHSILVEKNEFRGNWAAGTGPEGAGGGVSLRVEAIDLGGGDTVALSFRQNDVFDNTADSSDGGGVRASLLSVRSIDATLGSNTDPADEISLKIEDNTIRNNVSQVGGAGALLLVHADSDPDSVDGPCVPASQLPASGTIEFNRNLVTGNQANNLPGFDEVGAGILAIPSTVGEAEATILITGSTLAGNTITTNFESSGGLETLPFADPDCDGTLDAKITVGLDRSIVDGNDGYGIGGTPLSVSIPPDTLVVPITNSYVHGNASGNFEPEMYPLQPPSNFEIDPQLTGAFAPQACSPVFELKVCEGTTDVCLDAHDCPAGPPQVPCLAGVGFHGTPDIAPFVPDRVIDGMDTLGLALAFGATDAPDLRFFDPADTDHNGIVDGDDLSYIGSQFAEACSP